MIAAIVSTVQLASLDSQTNDIAVCALRDGQVNIANKVKNDRIHFPFIPYFSLFLNPSSQLPSFFLIKVQSRTSQCCVFRQVIQS